MAVAAVPAAVSYTMAAMSVAATLQSVAQARKTAAAQVAAQEERNDQIVESTIANYDQLSEAELSVQQQSLQRSLDTQKDYIKQKGKLNVMAAAMGTGGQSMQSQLNDLNRTKYSNFNTIQQDKQAELDNIADQATNMRYQAASSMSTQAISRPSWASGALSAASSGLQTYSAVSSLGSSAPSTTSGV